MSWRLPAKRVGAAIALVPATAAVRSFRVRRRAGSLWFARGGAYANGRSRVSYLAFLSILCSGSDAGLTTRSPTVLDLGSTPPVDRHPPDGADRGRRLGRDRPPTDLKQQTLDIPVEQALWGAAASLHWGPPLEVSDEPTG